MYDDKDLLQANVTLIAGVLIFLTFTPFSQGVREILERRNILYIIWATMTFFYDFRSYPVFFSLSQS